MCGYASCASPSCGSPSSWTDTYNNQNQTDHESEAITSTDCKERNLEKPSDPTNPSNFPKTETVETPLWDEDYWLNQAETNNSISVNMETQTDCWYDQGNIMFQFMPTTGRGKNWGILIFRKKMGLSDRDSLMVL